MMVSAGLLALLSLLFFGTVMPMLSRGQWFAGTQSHTRKFISARHYLQRRLHHVKVVTPASAPADPNLYLEYQRPEESDSSLGPMMSVDLSEIRTWQSTVCQLKRLNGVLVDTDQPGSFLRKVWPLAAADTVTVTPDVTGIDFAVEGVTQTKNSRITGTRWKYEFRVVTR